MRTLALSSSLALLFVIACSGSDTTIVTPPQGTGNDAGSPQGDGGSMPPVDGGQGADAGPGADGSMGDAIATSFAFVGCNRLSKGDWDPVSNASSANTVQLSQTFADLAVTSPSPSRFFMLGDLVLGLNADTTVLAGQLDGWKAFYDADPNAKHQPLTPITGNHEMLVKTSVGGTKVELSNAGADDVWTAWLASSGFDTKAGNGPNSSGKNPDLLVDDQSKLSYSFDENRVHYVMLNTDTITSNPDQTTGDTSVGWVPLAWLKDDLAAAQASSAIDTIFVMGHKPLVSPLGDTSADATIEASLVGPMEMALDATPKVKGYLCAHAHMWDAQKLPGSRGVFQVVAGNGGSSPESAWSAPVFGFTEVRVYQSGKVTVVSHERPVPSPYNSSPATAATAKPELTISP